MKDLDLKTRLFKHRCSYMIYSPVFAALPLVLKEQVFAKLANALRPDADIFALDGEERRSIRQILAETVEGFPLSF